MTTTALPATIRQLSTPAARELAAHAAALDDLQTVLRACDRLVTMLGESSREPSAGGIPDDLGVDALWTSAILAYGRCFAASQGALLESDVAGLGLAGDVAAFHQVLVQLRDRYADPVLGSREQYAVGVSQDAEGKVEGIAITSSRGPLVDAVTVRQTGAIALALSDVVEKRMAATQERLFATVSSMFQAELRRLPLMDVVTPGQRDSTDG